MKKERTPRNISFGESVGLLVFFVAFFIYAAIVLKLPTGMSVLLCAVIAAAYGMLMLGISWDSFFKSIEHVFQRGIGAILILLFVGIIIGSWLVSGTTPMLIYYGLQIISPGMFLMLAFLICSIVSMATGTGWGIMGSFGVALMGVAMGLGINPALAGAAIASGSYVGDKWSPFSDVPNLNSALTEGTSFDIMKAETPSTVPGIVGALLFYLFLGLQYRGGEMDYSLITPILETLQSHYTFNLLLLIPPLFVIVAGVLKFPVLPSLFGSGLIGGFLGIIVQRKSFSEVFTIMYSGFESNTGNEALDALLSGGGLQSMLSLILIIMCAFMFAGIIDRLGILPSILNNATRVATNKGHVVLASILTSILGVYLTSSVYVSCILNSRVWSDVYERVGLRKLHLGVILTEATSPMGLIVPWSGGALLMVSLFNLQWYEYAPYLVYYWISLVLLIVFAYTGKFLQTKTKSIYSKDPAAIKQEE